MSDESDDDTLGVQIANQFINVANARLQSGIRPDIVASALRNAAANFSAFVTAHAGRPDLGTEPFVEEFRRMLDYYIKLHRPEDDGTPLHRLIDQVKSEQP
jgi:hypothetical protein